jgi:hypothetical protein
LARCLAQIVQKHPDLVRMIETWPTLPKHVKTEIKGMIEKYSTEEKDDSD